MNYSLTTTFLVRAETEKPVSRECKLFQMLELLRTSIDAIDHKYLERKERDFAYELYHQIRLLKLPVNTEITCEFPKTRFNFDDQIMDDRLVRKYFFSDEISESARILRYPDLLIHEFDNLNQQLLAIEIKRGGNGNQIKKDLAKLIVYCKGRLNYKKGVLIIIQPRRNINQLITVPDIRKMLINYPEVEIWTVFPERIDVYNSLTIENH